MMKRCETRVRGWHQNENARGESHGTDQEGAFDNLHQMSFSL